MGKAPVADRGFFIQGNVPKPAGDGSTPRGNVRSGRGNVPPPRGGFRILRGKVPTRGPNVSLPGEQRYRSRGPPSRSALQLSPRRGRPSDAGGNIPPARGRPSDERGNIPPARGRLSDERGNIPPARGRLSDERGEHSPRGRAFAPLGSKIPAAGSVFHSPGELAVARGRRGFRRPAPTIPAKGVERLHFRLMSCLQHFEAGTKLLVELPPAALVSGRGQGSFSFGSMGRIAVNSASRARDLRQRRR